MTWQNFILLGTLLLSIYTLGYSIRNNRRTSYINSVTAERVKWINTLRENLSQFAGLVFHYAAVAGNDPTGSKWHNLLKDTDRLRMLIKLQLNPKGEIDEKIEANLDRLYTSNAIPSPQIAQSVCDQTIKLGQQLLKQEWEKVKEESKYGDLRDTWWRNFRRDQFDCSG